MDFFLVVVGGMATITNTIDFNSVRAYSSAPFPLNKGCEMDADYYEALYDLEEDTISYILNRENKPNNAFNRGYIRAMVKPIMEQATLMAEDYEEHGLLPEEYLNGFSPAMEGL